MASLDVHGLEARGLRLIEFGRTCSPIGVLPYLEEEAIARLRHATDALGDDEVVQKRQDWNVWRRKWVRRADQFMLTSLQGPINATAAYSAAEVLVRAADLRLAIEEHNGERAAALGMLIASWVFAGGVSVRLSTAESMANRHRAAQKQKASVPRRAFQGDGERLRKSDLVSDALKAAGNGADTPAVWGHLFGLLESRHLSPVESGAKDQRKIHATDLADKTLEFTFKGVQTMLAKLRVAAPTDIAVKRGRPRKKPA